MNGFSCSTVAESLVPPPTLSALTESYVAHAVGVRGVLESSAEAERPYLRRFFDWFGPEERPDRVLAAITPDSIMKGLAGYGREHGQGSRRCMQKTVYRYVNGGLLHTKRHDLPRACMLKPRKAKSVEHKVDAKCRIGRTYADYLHFIAQNPGLPVTEIDTVEGVKGGKVLLTLMFMPYGFMAAFLLPVKTSALVTEAFATIRRLLAENFGDAGGLELFARLFPVILTDNGTEFSAPSRIETDAEGNRLTRIYYCDPNAAFQKAHVERNHELLRKILPKGTPYVEPTSFDGLAQTDLDLVMSHVNSYLRESLQDRTPYDLFTTAFGTRVAELFGVRRIPADDIVLKPALLGIVQKTKNLG
jgi:transposase, IS30 family